MTLRNFLLLSMAAGAALPLNADTLLQHSGDVNAQCCEFAAYAISWHQSTTWTNVRVDLDIYNNDSDGNPQTGVALLLNSLGPGTTTDNKIDDAVVQSSDHGPQTATLFQGLTLGPGTYHLMFYGVTHSFGSFLAVAWNTSGSPIEGPGVTRLPDLVEDVKAAYRPASTWSPITGHPGLVSITGTPVPEPSTSALGVLAAAGIAVFSRWKR